MQEGGWPAYRDQLLAQLEDADPGGAGGPGQASDGAGLAGTAAAAQGSATAAAARKGKAIDAVSVEAQGGCWEAFHASTHGRFFKPRMFLLLEFPCLRALCSAAESGGAEHAGAPPGPETSSPSPATVWEVGCGAGSNVLPLLQTTPSPTLHVFASDFAPSAVAALQGHPDFDAARTTAFVGDITQGSLGAAAPSDAFQRHGADGVQAVLLMFVLSALHPDKHEVAVRNAAAALAPGGALCFRDYGVWDHAMLRFKARALVDRGATGPLFTRGDGTLAYYATPDYISSLLSQAGLAVREASYARVLNRNRKKGTCIRRVFVHALGIKPHTHEQSTAEQGGVHS